MKQLLPLLFLFAVLTAQAQSKLSDKPTEFVGDVKGYFYKIHGKN